MSKVSKFMNALSNGQSLTHRQMMQRFGFASRSSASGRVAELRNSGVDVLCFTHKTKPSRYALVTQKNALTKQGFTVTA